MEEWRTLLFRAYFNTRIKWTLHYILLHMIVLGWNMHAGFVHYSLKWSNLGTRKIFGIWFFLHMIFLINSSADVHMHIKWSHCLFPRWIHRISGTYRGFARFTGIPLACIILEKCFLMWQKSEFRSWTVYFGKSDDLHCQAPAFRLTLSINRLKLSSRNLAGHHSRSVLSLKTRFRLKVLSETAFSHWALCLRIAVIDGVYIWPPHQDFPYHILKHSSLLIIRLKYVFFPLSLL